MRIFSAAALAALLWLPAQAAAQAERPWPSDDCGDDNGVDRCAPAQQAKTRALFGAAPIEQLSAEETQIVRAFFVNGYGRDEPMIAFVRPKGKDAEAIVTVAGGNAAERKTLRAPVPAATWNRLLGQARYFDRDLVPLTKDSNDLSICLHSWVVTVEAATPKEGVRGGVRRKTQDACGEGMAVPLAFEMAEAAIDLMPACAELDPKQHRNTVTRLGACAHLEGDRIAAAQAMNQYERDSFANPGSGTEDAIRYLFYEQAEIEWPGEQAIRGGGAAAKAWVGHMQKRHLWLERAVGEAPDRVRIEGWLQDMSSEKASEWQRARATQIWTRENGFDFRLRSLKVGKFEARR